MSNPKQQLQDIFVNQFIADLALLPQATVANLAKDLSEDTSLSDIEKTRSYLKSKPNKTMSLFAEVIKDMPYYAPLRHFRYIDERTLILNFDKQLREIFGITRLELFFDTHLYLLGGKKVKELLSGGDPKNYVLASPPDLDKVKELDAEISKQLVSIDTVANDKLSKLLIEAQDRAVKTENEFEKAKLRWDNHINHVNKQAERVKLSAVEDVKIELSRENAVVIDELTRKLNAVTEEKNDALLKLQKAEQYKEEIVQAGGATPERVAEIRAEIQREADNRLADELSEKTRPWIAVIKNATEAYSAYDEATKLSREALELAKKEAIEKDPILKWKTHSAQAITALQAQLSQIDALINVTVEPSAALLSMRAKLLQLLTICRERANPAEPTGEVMKALHVGIKNVPADNIDEVTNAFLLLSTFDVLAHEEGQNLKRALEARKRLLIESGKTKTSTKAKLRAAIHKNEKVVLLIDVLNFMRSNEVEFSKFEKGKDANGAAMYKSEAFDHLVKIVATLRDTNPKVEIHLFMDGKIIKNTQPRAGITFHNPTIKTTGDGQADAEIFHFLAHRCPKDALIITVTSDKAVQLLSDKHLDVDSFYTILKEQNKK
jgi:hypothetical protein